jgi:hypothetical protein
MSGPALIYVVPELKNTEPLAYAAGPSVILSLAEQRVSSARFREFLLKATGRDEARLSVGDSAMNEERC